MIERILDMQRRGTKDYEQAAKLLESYYNSLNSNDRSEFFALLEAILLGEPLYPVVFKNSISLR